MVEQKLAELYNLILNPNTREWERTLLIQAKNQAGKRKQRKEILEMIEVSLRPLALRGNLTPDVTDFYLKITHDPMGQVSYDFVKHQITDERYQEKAVFAGGCFWCLVEPFETRQGIISVLSGYTGGEVEHPNYDQVSSGTTGHVEAVEIIFDQRMINYEELLAIFWQVTDPTDAFGQFQDRGNQYRSIIFVENEEQKILAEKSKQQVIASHQFAEPIVTQIKPATTFWPAENYHQQFYKKQQQRYKKIKKSHQQFLFFKRAKKKWSGGDE
ncbi:peptide-methionine (S)-S-oxide reductase MsrA [Enterococcus hirae]|nr:peptide-methionine (S)-S-oxide reductase MsrA [Enterococcus hirae]